MGVDDRCPQHPRQPRRSCVLCERAIAAEEDRDAPVEGEWREGQDQYEAWLNRIAP